MQPCLVLKLALLASNSSSPRGDKARSEQAGGGGSERQWDKRSFLGWVARTPASQ